VDFDFNFSTTCINVESSTWLVACSAYYTTLKIEALHCSEISVTVYQIIQQHIREDFTFHSSRLQEHQISTQSVCVSSAIAKDPYLGVRLLQRVVGRTLSGDGLSLSMLHCLSACHFVLSAFPGCTCWVTPLIQRLFCSWDAL
jgi:hypothetical protein